MGSPPCRIAQRLFQRRSGFMPASYFFRQQTGVKPCAVAGVSKKGLP